MIQQLEIKIRAYTTMLLSTGNEIYKAKILNAKAEMEIIKKQLNT